LMSWWMKNPLRKRVLIGFNPFKDAATLLDLLESKGIMGFDGDSKEWDRSMAPLLIRLFNILLKAFYRGQTEEERLAREAFIEALCSSYVVFMDFVISVVGNLPSGCPLTTHINCFINFVLCTYCMTSVMLKADGRRPYFEDDEILFDKTTLLILQSTAMIFLGDDNCINPGKLPITMRQIAAEMLRFGIKYTPVDKQSELYGVKRIKDCTIVGRSFRYDDDKKIWCMPIRDSTLQNLLNWINLKSKSDTPDLDKVEEYLRELSLKGKARFVVESTIVVNEFITKYGLTPNFTDWSITFDHVVNSDFIYE